MSDCEIPGNFPLMSYRMRCDYYCFVMCPICFVHFCFFKRFAGWTWAAMTPRTKKKAAAPEKGEREEEDEEDEEKNQTFPPPTSNTAVATTPTFKTAKTDTWAVAVAVA